MSLDLPHDQLVELNRRHLWNPFTQMKGYLESDPLVITRGEGVRLFDAEGRSYLDGNSSLWLNIHGHNRPELNAAITEQLGRIAHSTLLGMDNVPAIALAERLAAITPEGLQNADRSTCLALFRIQEQPFEIIRLQPERTCPRLAHE